MALCLIITADDLGYSVERNDGIFTCYRDEVITRSSLLVNGVAAKEAAMAAKDNNIPLGIYQFYVFE